MVPSTAAAAGGLAALLALSEVPSAAATTAAFTAGPRSCRTCRCQLQVGSSPTNDDAYDYAPTRPFVGGLSSRNLHPVVTSVLLRASRDNPRRFGLDDLSRSLGGLHIWGEALRKGRLPTEEEFHDGAIWPERPLYDELVRVLIDLELPRFVLRHPETADAVLLSMLRLVIQYQYRLSEDGEEGSDDASTDVNVEYTSNNVETMAVNLADDLAVQWGGIVQAMGSLDQLFGLDHGLLDPSLIMAEEDDMVDELDDGEDGDDTTDSSNGFGLNDGIWSHSGWAMMPPLQAGLARMPELRHLISSLGKRPSAEGKDMQKFPPQVRSSRTALGVEVDPLSRESVRGITRTSSLTEMLPSEAALLKGSPALRRLFLAKKVEGKLLGYDISGYADIPSRPKKRRSSYMKRLPSAPGGPIIVCLDTSYSMTGDREILSKAVVLECVKMAHRQQRDCTVVAFSSESNTLECDLLAADKGGLAKLLSFLQHSFSGGTDVTGALRHALNTLGTDTMRAADILLVSDGELQNPPVNESVTEELDRLKQESSMEIHGLLIGKTESEPLEALCSKDKVYDFLAKYDALGRLIGAH